MAEAPRKRAKDEEIVAIVVKVILDEGTVASQTSLARLVNKQLARRNMHVTAPRIRNLAIRSGLVGITIRTRTNGTTPTLERCPVCHNRLRATANRTLTAYSEPTKHGSTHTGYRCTRCPWWTGRELRIPQHYTFHAKVTRTEKGQVTFQTHEKR